MLLKDMKVLFPRATVKTFEGKRVIYTHPDDLYHCLNLDDWNKIKDWNRICILSSPTGKPNKCFYFYFGYGGCPEILQDITIYDNKNDRY